MLKPSSARVWLWAALGSGATESLTSLTVVLVELKRRKKKSQKKRRKKLQQKDCLLYLDKI